MVTLRRGCAASIACLLMAAPALARAQGILTLSPARPITTTAGTGTAGYSGDSSAATSAKLFNPVGAVYDAAGNLYFSDSLNNVVRQVAAGSGTITTVAGNGEQGYAGDGGAATSAALDMPVGIALDSSGNLYIADSHNHAIRKVTGTTISTVAGTGTAGFSGDGGAATAATLYFPQGVAVDGSGNLYIADTGNQRVRKVTGTTIATIAGSGDEANTGDGGAAAAASLDRPAGLALDASGNLYIADSHNHVVRMISGTTISTIAGSGTNGFSGDGGAATAASFSFPQAVAVDAAGSLYVADSRNNRIREVANGSIATVAGAGSEDFAGDGLAAVDASLDTPRGVAPDAQGNLAVGDTLNQRVRSVPLTTLAFGSEPVGGTSSTLTIVHVYVGSSQLQVGSFSLPSQFVSAGGTCSAPPITIAPQSSCSISLAFAPTVAAPASGSVTFSGTGLIPQGLLLTGSGTAGTPTIAFSVSRKHDYDAPFQVMATSNSTGAFTYSVVSGPATVVGSTVTLTGASGTVVLRASEAADANYAAGAVDAAFAVSMGTVWADNSSGGLSALDLTGVPYSSTAYTGGGLTAAVGPQGLAIDGPGYEWVANSGSSGISKLDGDGLPVGGSPFTGGGVVNPKALAIDGKGAVWIANAGGRVSVLANSGAVVSGASGYAAGGSSLSGISIDTSGNVWISDSGSNRVVEILGGAAPAPPLSTAVANGTVGSRP